MTLPAEPRFAVPAARMVEAAGRAFDFPPETWRGLSLACEEIVAYVARHAETGSAVALVCRDGLHRMTLEVSPPAKSFDPRLFNITQSLRSDDEMDELGLLLAARMVDEFAFDRNGGELRLRLAKSRPYSRIETAEVSPPPAAGRWSVVPFSPDHATALCRLILSSDDAPAFAARPGKVADMAAAGELSGAVAEDEAGHVIGGALWFRSGRIVELLGPYHSGDAAAALAMVEACLITEARGPALGVLSRRPEQDFPEGMFEIIGVSVTKAPVRFRALAEDPGASVWVVPEIAAFLTATYRDLGFARRVRPLQDVGRWSERHSLIVTSIDSESGRAVVRPSLPGADRAENIAQHRRHFENAGITDVSCEIDLGDSQQVEFCPDFIAAGFEPSHIIPHGREGDILVMRLVNGATE